MFTWSGYVADMIGSKVVVNTKQITKPWSEFTGEERAHTFIVRFDNKKEIVNVKQGDKITVSGSVESRGHTCQRKNCILIGKCITES